MNEIMTVTDGASLERWRSTIRAILVPGAMPPVRFELAGFDNRRLNHEAGRYGRACGCGAAGLAMAAAVLWIGLSLLLEPRPLAAVGLLEWLKLLLIVLAAGAVGKLAGLFWARRRLVRLADDVAGQLGLGEFTIAR